MTTRRTALCVFASAAQKALAGRSAGDALLTGKVVDRATGRIMACMVEVRSSAGEPVFGDFRSSGEFRVGIPSGKAEVTVSCGFDYVASTKKLRLNPGEHSYLQFDMERITPLRRRGWYCGDSHIHPRHGSTGTAPGFSVLALAARANGLDYISAAQGWDLPDISPEALDRACAGEKTLDFQMAWNLEAPKNYYRGDVSHCLGHGWTLGMRGRTGAGLDVIAELLQLSAGDYQREKQPVPNFEIHALIHELGGIVSYTHPCRWWRGKWGGEGGYPIEESKFISNLAQELPFDTIAGPTFDMLDILMGPREERANEQAQQLWFMLLNHGYRLAATGSSDTTFDNPKTARPGKARVYTRLDGPFAWERLAAAMKSGRNFVTSGPLVHFAVAGHEPGDIIAVSGRSEFEAEVQAWPSGEPGESLAEVEVIQNGDIIRTFPVQPGAATFRARLTLEATGNGWCVVRCRSASAGSIAVTNPIYFSAADYTAPIPTDASVEVAVRDAVTGDLVSGICEVIRMSGRTEQKLSEIPFAEGKFRVTVPAAARLRIVAAGYRPATRSVFLEYPGFRDLTLNMRVEQLLDWATFESIRAMLKRVTLDIAMERG